MEQPDAAGAPKVQEHELHSGDAVTIRSGVARRFSVDTTSSSTGSPAKIDIRPLGEL